VWGFLLVSAMFGSSSIELLDTTPDLLLGCNHIDNKEITMTAKQVKLSANEVAEQVGTDPKTLRRFLRENDSYSNPGSGGRYEFVQKDVAPMKRAFVAWQKSKPAPKSTSKKSAQASAKTTKRTSKTQTRAERKSAADKRVDALEASLKSSGKHISQHADK
jgi:hypothetical protein